MYRYVAYVYTYMRVRMVLFFSFLCVAADKHYKVWEQWWHQLLTHLNVGQLLDLCHNSQSQLCILLLIVDLNDDRAIM